MFYSKTTCGFYSSEIHGKNIPADAVEISDAEYVALLQGQSDGLKIWVGENGRPELIAPSELTFGETVAAKKADLARLRYKKEVGGVVLPNGQTIATDDRSKALIAGARLDTMTDPAIVTDWKTDLGWVQIDAATVAVIATAVAAHVRSCFSAERSHCEAIDALAADPATTAAEIDEYDFTTGWPI